ncbi:histidine kinase [Streptomyces sp. NBC_01275]|uniref:sensor histidine kinase n=1 Tax=Streptomyces sp. NBC_01275 TaxID=2903807 RepID=UPI00225718E8|nr:sensor histidine kinase [Streptomyces sp. NBC_01275]MCX4763843.1 histidine kinase [Streptomyces sp. NBC_01275]
MSKHPLRDGIGLLRHPTGPLPRPTRRSLAFDAVLVLAFGVVILNWAVNQGADLVRGSNDGIAPLVRATETGSVIAAAALAVLAWAPLALRRRYPLTTLWIVTSAAVLTPHDARRLVFYACVVAAYSAAAYSPYRVATLASLPVLVLTVAGDTDGVMVSPSTPVPNQYVPLLILVPLLMATVGLRTWRLRADESRAKMSVLEREQAEELRRAAGRERARIARELHDVITHNVSMMVIQTGAARKVMDTAPDQARDALLAAEAGGRAALAELRHAIGLLTMDADDGADAAATADLAPQPGLDQLESLIARVRHTGVPVTLSVTDVPHDVPAGIGLAAYRVVQEALTNTVKHATGASATVTVTHEADHLRVEVADTGGSPSASAATGNGRGLIGLRERLAVYDGTLHTGRRLTGGYRVTALIPLETP